MPSNTSISISQLTRLIGVPGAPVIIDVRKAPDFEADTRLLPGARRRDATRVAEWAHELKGKHVVVACQRGALFCSSRWKAKVTSVFFVGRQSAVKSPLMPS